MKKFLVTLAMLFIAALPLRAQIQIPPNLANDGSTGTTAAHLVKLTTAGPSTLVTSSAGDTAGAVGICDSGCGTSGKPIIATDGIDSCAFDGAATAGHFVQISSSIAGDCTDSGSASPPTSGEIIGRVTGTIGSAGSAPVLLMFENSVGGSGGSGTVGSGTVGQIAAYNNTSTIQSIPLAVYPDAIVGGGIGQASVSWVTATTYPLCQLVSNSGNYIAVSSSNGATTPGTNSHIWWPIPNASRPTQFDCAFYIAQSLVTSTQGIDLHLGAGTYNSCIGMTYPTVGGAGNPGVNIHGGGVGVSIIKLTCTLLSGSGGDGLAFLNVPVAATGFFLPRLQFSNFTLDANAFSWPMDLHACQQCVLENIDFLNPAPGSNHAFECGTVSGGSTGWCFELTAHNLQAGYNPGVTGHAHGNNAATFTVTSVGGGTPPTIAVNAAGANYDSTQLTMRLVTGGGLEACTSVGTITPTFSGSGFATVTTTSTGCKTTGNIWLQIYPQINVAYGFRFSNMSDSHDINSLICGGVGSSACVYTQNVNAMNSYTKIHPVNSFNGIQANGSEQFHDTQLDSVYNHGIETGGAFNTLSFTGTQNEWNNNNYQGSSGFDFTNVANPPTSSPAAIFISDELCGNAPHQGGYAHLVNGGLGGTVDSGFAIPPRVHISHPVHCDQFQSATAIPADFEGQNLGWSNGVFNNVFVWGLGSNTNKVLSLTNSSDTATSPFSFFLNTNTLATSGQNSNSPLLGTRGSYWNGSGPIPYGAGVATTFAAGSNPLATHTFQGFGTAPSAGDLWTFDGPAALLNNSTGVTQSVGDASTKLATDAFVNTAVGAVSGFSGCTTNCSYVLTTNDLAQMSGGAGGALATNNQGMFIRFYNDMNRTLGTSACLDITTNLAAGTADVGVYSVSGTTGTLQWHTGAIDTTNTGVNCPSVVSTAYTMAPGTYFLGWCADNTTVAFDTITSSGFPAAISASGSSPAHTHGLDATDGCTGGILPSTITTTNIVNSSAHGGILYVYVSN